MSRRLSGRRTHLAQSDSSDFLHELLRYTCSQEPDTLPTQWRQRHAIDPELARKWPPRKRLAAVLVARFSVTWTRRGSGSHSRHLRHTPRIPAKEERAPPMATASLPRPDGQWRVGNPRAGASEPMILRKKVESEREYVAVNLSCLSTYTILLQMTAVRPATYIKCHSPLFW